MHTPQKQTNKQNKTKTATTNKQKTEGGGSDYRHQGNQSWNCGTTEELELWLHPQAGCYHPVATTINMAVLIQNHQKDVGGHH